MTSAPSANLTVGRALIARFEPDTRPDDRLIGEAVERTLVTEP